MARVLLLLPTSTYRATDFIDAARTLGAEVVVGSNEEQALADAMGARALEIDFDDPKAAAEAIVDNSREMPVDAVVAVDDQGVLTAALAAERLGLKHNSPDSVALTRDKAGMREALSNSAVNQPEFELARGAAEAVAAVERIGFPCVLKPVSLSASRGVIRVDDEGAAQDAAKRIVAILDESEADDEQRILVERYIPGIEVAVEGLLRGGRLEVLAIFDKPDPLEGPYFEETIYTTPSRHSRREQDAIVEAMEQAVDELGLTEGPIHAEARFNGSGVWLLELAARSIGGLCARTLRFGLGVSLEELILRHALGLPVADLKLSAAAGVMMLPIPRAGCLQEVNGQEDAETVPGITGLEITIPVGREVRPLPEADRYLGFMFAKAETPDEVEEALRTAYGKLGVSIG